MALSKNPDWTEAEDVWRSYMTFIYIMTRLNLGNADVAGFKELLFRLGWDSKFGKNVFWYIRPLEKSQ
jgi:hypothetical protein